MWIAGAEEKLRIGYFSCFCGIFGRMNRIISIVSEYLEVFIS